jgi:hypothetical protein
MIKIEDIKARQKGDAAKIREYAKQTRLSSQFLLGSHNKVRLRKALSAVGRFDLAERTLLDPVVHKAHAEKLAGKFLAKWNTLKDKRLADWSKVPASHRRGTSAPSSHAIAAEHVRFLTLIDSVTIVDAASALQAALRMRDGLKHAVGQCRGIWCLGAIEVEVVSMSKMRRIRELDVTSDSEMRKLDVCETLARDLAGSLYKDESSLMLIHFHGIVMAKDEVQFEELRDRLKLNDQWIKAGRQIELKKISESFKGTAKTVEKSLEHIATYITKGGNDWYANKAYLRYKIAFENDDSYVTDEESWTAKNWRRHEMLKREHKDEGITDSLSLTGSEVVELATAIDGLMGLNRTRTGYLISASS